MAGVESRMQRMRMRLQRDPPSIKFRNTIYTPQLQQSAQPTQKKVVPAKQIIDRIDIQRLLQTFRPMKSRSASVQSEHGRKGGFTPDKETPPDINETISIIPRQSELQFSESYEQRRFQEENRPLAEIRFNSNSLAKAPKHFSVGNESSKADKADKAKAAVQAAQTRRIQKTKGKQRPAKEKQKENQVARSNSKSRKPSLVVEGVQDLRTEVLVEGVEDITESFPSQASSRVSQDQLVRVRDIVRMIKQVEQPKNQQNNQSCNQFTIELDLKAETPSLALPSTTLRELTVTQKYKAGELVQRASAMCPKEFEAQLRKALAVRLSYPSAAMREREAECRFNQLGVELTGGWPRRLQHLSASSIRATEDKLNSLDSKLDQYIKLHMGEQASAQAQESPLCFKELKQWL